MSRPGAKQFVWLAVAVAFLVCAGLVTGTLDTLREKHDLVPPGNPVARNYPSYALLTIAPGGLRAPIVAALWIRAEDLKNAGRFYESTQLAEMICHLMPRVPGVWGNRAWNMAWNISVKAQTPQERWLWVHSGIELLRDKGIPMNPKALELYKELGWIFFSKMGQTTDEMHRAYKQRWAAMMQHVLGAPSYGQTQQVIDAFRPIAQAPLDKSPDRIGRDLIQADQREILLRDPGVAQYAQVLAGRGVKIDESLLDAYNRFSRDDGVELTRGGIAPQTKTEADQQIYVLINSPRHADARGKMLAFLRAQILWNRYKMDPAWMLHLMEKYKVPLDWRLVQPHGLYWVTYGIDYCGGMERADVNALNTDRVALNCLKALTWNGRLTYLANPRQPEWPLIQWGADWRFIKPTHDIHVSFIKATSDLRQEAFEQSKLRSGHTNYLIAAINMLYVGGRRSQAASYFDWLREHYPKKGDIWNLELTDFVMESLTKDDRPIADLARNQLHASIVAAYAESVWA